MARQDENDQDQRTGGYGGSSGGAMPDQPATGGEEASAAGRDTPVSSPLDSDEALGNRTGGYGGNPSSVEPDREPDDR